VVGISGIGWSVLISKVRSSITVTVALFLANRRIVSRQASSGLNWRVMASAAAAALKG
jgi:ribose 1,5-bisphosphokinase PhnN